MLLFLGWILFSIIPAVIASNKGRSGFGWFCLSLAISPLFAGILVACLGPIAANVESRALTEGMRKCPFCAELVRWEAKICRFCHSDLTQRQEGEAHQAPTPIRYTPVTCIPDRCPSCGSSKIITLLVDRLYHCGKCGREYELVEPKV